MEFFVILLIGFITFMVYGFAKQNNTATVELKIATFGCDIAVHDLRLGYNSFWVYVDFGDEERKVQFFGNFVT